MIIIITGATHTGKTRLAQLILEKESYPYVSEDHVKMGLIRSGYTDLTPSDDKELTDYLWPVFREMIKTAIENNQNLVVEGCYVPFDWKEDFTEEYLKEIRFICLCLSEGYIDKHFGDIKENASCIESRIDDDYCTPDVLKSENRFYLEGFKSRDMEVLLIEDDYTGAINKGLESLVK